MSVSGRKKESGCLGGVPLKHAADGVKVIGRQRWKPLAVQVLEAAAKCVGIDLPVNPGGGDDESRRQLGAQTGGDGELVGQGAAKARVVAGGQRVASHVDNHEVVGFEQFSCGGYLLGHADSARGWIEEKQTARQIAREAGE